MTLNENLLPDDAPIVQNQEISTAFDFDAANERNSIDLTKIKNFSFSSGIGGTLTLGGPNNGNGVLVVKDGSDATIITFGATGGTINTGNLVIQDALGSTIIDSSGLVSDSSNFGRADSVNDSLNQTVSGTAKANVTGGTLAAFVLTRPTNVLVNYFTACYMTQSVGNTGNLVIRLQNGTAELGRIPYTGIPVTDTSMRPSSNFYQTKLAAGTYAFNLTAQQESVSGTPSSNVFAFGLGYYLFGN